MGLTQGQSSQSTSKDTAAVTHNACSKNTFELYPYHLLLVAFVASIYGLYHELYGVYREYASRHSKHHHNMYFASSQPSSSFTAIEEPPTPESNCTKSVFLPYVHKFKTENIPLVKVTIHAGDDNVDIDMPVDTGSTGLLIGAPLLPGIDPNAGTRGWQYLSSSNIVYVGRYLDLNLTFHGANGATAETRVPVLVVDKSWMCPWYDPSKHGFECPSGPDGQEPVERDVGGITYMGVGFGRNKNAEGQRTATSWGNAFLNIHAINGEPVGSKDIKAGYVVSTKGIQLGLTKKHTSDFAFMNLDRGVTHGRDARDWAMPRMQFRVNGRKSVPGYALLDTGIPQMYIRAEDDMPIPEVIIKNPKAGTPTVHRVKNGTSIAVDFGTVIGGRLGGVKASYSFVVGKESLMAPSYVVPGRQEPPPYVNTGRNFLKGYSIAFDALDGRLGFQPVPSYQSNL
ncbi:hypothetical protein BU23DRAFT_555305 [Bimuria novae-zelandiae CBS 107.79]|uniref:Acid protease n=1 Tax=Bimuria novae-zelandiae CBS 107.79 TaxID=1447943 RepID=A0A6A5V4C9_9PLEO|nr:hypothetical protein BU23DRAFT_555305 [Bimuria novae-zelandiae CBS 107.79]